MTTGTTGTTGPDGLLAPEGSVDELWRRFKHDGDAEARERLILQYAPLVKYVAGRVRLGLPSEVDPADLISDGVVGLMDAIDKFDLGRGLQFQTYAVSRVRGAIVDGLRASDWAPRSLRAKAREHEAATTALEARLGRPPSDAELAESLGTTAVEVRHIREETGQSRVVSLDADEQAEAALPATMDDLVADDDLPEGFLTAVHELPERDRIIVALYYWDRLTLAEIGTVLGVTESRVSQLHSRAAATLRRRLVGQVP